LDVEKQVDYWRHGARESLRSVPVLADGEFWAEALFWTHLGVEKALKAHVVKVTGKAPPYIHNLTRLAEIAGLDPSPAQLRLCDSLNRYQRIARYPYESVQEPDSDTSRRLLQEAKEFIEWLLTRL
jgi:HEPN domain-containing protein